MAKVVIHLLHGDAGSLSAGSHVAERVRQVAGEQQVELEVYCFGAAQAALTDRDGSTEVKAYNDQLDALIAAGVPVGACLNAAQAAGVEEVLRKRGFTLQYARDAFVRYAIEGATVIGF
ncbi:DsrE family protein [Ferrimicrobium sp.]|uniref:DsrE family protein n=1 Tax=Ferrimicrobium sp. TaxID=2926050 RepID=UPI002632689D|nr:DsrE family protein [Ferrimicrobium sp.]